MPALIKDATVAHVADLPRRRACAPTPAGTGRRPAGRVKDRQRPQYDIVRQRSSLPPPRSPGPAGSAAGDRPAAAPCRRCTSLPEPRGAAHIGAVRSRRACRSPPCGAAPPVRRPTSYERPVHCGTRASRPAAPCWRSRATTRRGIPRLAGGGSARTASSALVEAFDGLAGIGQGTACAGLGEGGRAVRNARTAGFRPASPVQLIMELRPAWVTCRVRPRA